MNDEDPRLALLHKEWLEGRACLDIGCNTGQVGVRDIECSCDAHMISGDHSTCQGEVSQYNSRHGYRPQTHQNCLEEFT